MGTGWGNTEQIVDEANVLCCNTLATSGQRPSGERGKSEPSIPIMPAASGARRSVQNSKAFLHLTTD